jgi:hypothetical protein
MHEEMETEKALLVAHNGVAFWIQKRWMKNGKLTPAGWKTYRDAEAARRLHFNFDALKEFELVRETEKAALLCCVMTAPNRRNTNVRFWLPKSMADNWDFVEKKIRGLECECPYVNARVLWSGNGEARGA